MDIFEFRAKRVVDTSGVFDSTPMALDSGISGLFTRLKNLTTSEMHTQWDIAFLETYIREAMVPRSLRWEVPPQQGDPDLEGWVKFFNDAGLGLLRFLIQRKSDKLLRLDGEIKNIKEQLTPHINSEDYKEQSKGLLKTLEKEDKDQKIKKKKKYIRDKQDYQSGLIFIWQKKLAIQTEEERRMDTQPQGAGSASRESVSLPTKQGTHAPSKRDVRPKNNKSRPPRVGPSHTLRGDPSGFPGQDHYQPPRPNYFQRSYDTPPPATWENPPWKRNSQGYNGGPIQHYHPFDDPRNTVPTNNRFYPLSDFNSPQQRRANPEGYGHDYFERNQSVQFSRDPQRDYNYPGPLQSFDPPRGNNNSNWGFPKDTRAPKRSGERKEEPEGGGEFRHPKKRKI